MIVLVAITMTVLLAFAGLAIDVGSWFHAQRQLQANVDSGALAGVQDLAAATPTGSQANALSTATAFINANDTNNPDWRSSSTTAVTTSTPSGSGCDQTNCFTVTGSKQTNGLLATVVGSVFGSVKVTAHAQAFVGPPSELNNVSAAAIPLSESCAPPPAGTCTLPDNGVHLDFAAGATLLDLKDYGPDPANLNPTTNSTNTMESWIESGYNQPLPIDQWYPVDNGDHNGLKQAFQNVCGSNCGGSSPPSTVLIPVWSQQYPTTGTASAYYVVGFAALVVTSVDNWSSGNGGRKITGNLVNYIASGLSGGPCTSCRSFGVLVVGLDG
jgi:hypothetical protein